MPEFLILKCQGAMQAWGGHTYEDYRPSLIFPTRSAVVGLLGACLGINRQQPEQLKKLNDSFELTVLANHRLVEQRQFKDERKPRTVNLHKITDYHTVLNARRADGGKRDDAIVSRREYLCDAEFTLALAFKDSAEYDLAKVLTAIKAPKYTPYLGRRSCPLQRPLFEAIVGAEDAQQALKQIETSGTLYSETPLNNAHALQVRDLPLFGETRRFVTRPVYVLGG
ncbi:type I-E CRISPR-associated protein Cas5/CasD [Methylomonas koyamae]|uniref:Type I-E CRISPR-associated protein Cas5/CasD n=1 Tax=Methylomonas koyamae TaxID=702114 RepID=A0A291IHB3_9GAMM|nr:type I-E CRISPR-associated protein Cas5/CasD [Methylomonas koyamae]ATG89560.1 type I-E CRISPR-associated protein Cas5/CasD [Methylomonas koyamae]OAI23442.1 type I-E CRISPR-associated protein Cas5/CasD [Methylomonas koyamae]WNB74751.1 type I-E CRISPR-associated protein Cas5/CasD [Methylomonas koyamae]